MIFDGLFEILPETFLTLIWSYLASVLFTLSVLLCTFETGTNKMSIVSYKGRCCRMNITLCGHFN